MPDNDSMLPSSAGHAGELARRLAAAYAGAPEVHAVALGGSRANPAAMADAASDIDLYVYAAADLPLAFRTAVASGAAGSVELDNRFFEPGDEWVDRDTGVGVDVMFRRPAWIEDQLDRVLVRHEASVGYSTAFWHNVLHSKVLFDRDGWLAALQRRAQAPYPEPLRRAVVAKNQPLLRRNRSSYLRQIERAIARGDGVSVNHRVAAFLASWFDVLFALNRVPHPGEKRLVEIAELECPSAPAGFAGSVRALVAAIPRGDAAALAAKLTDGLDALLAADGLLEP
jgi:hypothetical protein